MKWYLAGPICHVKDDSDKEWREEAKRYLKDRGHGYIDPFEEEKIPETDIENPKEFFNQLRIMSEWKRLNILMQPILYIDKISVTNADGVLCYSPEPSWGTIRECTLAHEQSKPIVIFTGGVHTKDNMSNTMVGMASAIVETLDDAIDECLKYD